MNRLTSPAQTHITVNGVNYALNQSYRAALLTVGAFYAHESGELHADPKYSAFIAADIAIENMLTTEPPFDERQEAVQLIGEYINKYSRNSEHDTGDSRPLLDLEQDAAYIFDAFQLLGVDLDVEEITFPRFMSLLRVLPEKAPLCRIVYLRQLIRDGKIGKKEHSAERKEIERVWGWDVIRIKNRKAEKDRQDKEDDFKALQNRKRAERGLPPL